MISRFQDFSIVLESLPFGAMCVLLEEYRVCHGEVRLYVVGGTLIHVKLSVAGSWMLGRKTSSGKHPRKTPPKRDVLKLMR